MQTTTKYVVFYKDLENGHVFPVILLDSMEEIERISRPAALATATTTGHSYAIAAEKIDIPVPPPEAFAPADNATPDNTTTQE